MNKHPPFGNINSMAELETATLAAGCFWCVEAVFLEARGAVKVESGYMGGHDPAPTYENVCGGGTGHAEVVRVVQEVLAPK